MNDLVDNELPKPIFNYEREQKIKNKELKKLSEPLIRWLRDNYHPHAKIVVGYDYVEVVEGSRRVNNILTDEIK